MAFLQVRGLLKNFESLSKGIVRWGIASVLVFGLLLNAAHAEELGFFTPVPPSAPASGSEPAEPSKPTPAEDSEETPPSWSQPSDEATPFPPSSNPQTELAPYLDLFERLIEIKSELSRGLIPDPATLRKFYGDFLQTESEFSGAVLTPLARERAELILEIVGGELETGFANISVEAPAVFEKIYAATATESGTELWRLMRNLTSAKRFLLNETIESQTDLIAEYADVLAQIDGYFSESPAPFAVSSTLRELLERSQVCENDETGSAAWQCLKSRFL